MLKSYSQMRSIGLPPLEFVNEGFVQEFMSYNTCMREGCKFDGDQSDGRSRGYFPMRLGNDRPRNELRSLPFEPQHHSNFLHL